MSASWEIHLVENVLMADEGVSVWMNDRVVRRIDWAAASRATSRLRLRDRLREMP